VTHEVQRGLTLWTDPVPVVAAAPAISAANESETCCDALSYRCQSRKIHRHRTTDRPIHAVEPQSMMASPIALRNREATF